MALYQLLPQTIAGLVATILRTTDGAVIPMHPSNRDYQDFLTWQAAGNTADAKPVMPKDVATADNTFGADPWAGLGGSF